VGYARFHELRPRNREAVTPVEPCSIELRIQAHARVPTLPRLLDQGLQQQRTRAFGAPLLQYCHAPDVAVWKQPPRSDRQSVFSQGERVIAIGVLVVHFKPQRHALFAHEHQFADAARLGARLVPPAQADGKCCC